MFRRMNWATPDRRFGFGLTAVAAVTAVAMLAQAASAADGGTATECGPLFALRYWDNFVDYWTGAFRKQNGVVLLVLGAGAVALFIITRGKALK